MWKVQLNVRKGKPLYQIVIPYYFDSQKNLGQNVHNQYINTFNNQHDPYGIYTRTHMCIQYVIQSDCKHRLPSILYACLEDQWIVRTHNAFYTYIAFVINNVGDGIWTHDHWIGDPMC